MRPVEAHLDASPGDFVGAQAILLSAVLGVPVAPDDPEFEAARANAEPLILDEPTITLATFAPGDLHGRPVTIALGDQPNELVAAASGALSGLIGTEPVRVEAPHEVYLADPAVLTTLVARVRATGR